MAGDEPEFVSPLQRLGGALFGRRRPRARRAPLDDGSTLDLRCPRCAARLRARCGRTNACPRCGERVAVPGADVARALMPLTGDALDVRRKLTGDGAVESLPAPLLVLGFEPPWYLVRVRGERTGWVAESGTRLVAPQPPAKG